MILFFVALFGALLIFPVWPSRMIALPIADAGHDPPARLNNKRPYRTHPTARNWSVARVETETKG